MHPWKEKTNELFDSSYYQLKVEVKRRKQNWKILKAGFESRCSVCKERINVDDVVYFKPAEKVKYYKVPRNLVLCESCGQICTKERQLKGLMK